MSALSNLFRPRDPGPVVYRAAMREEIEPAMRLIVGGSRGQASDEQVLDFLSFAIDRGIDVNATWVATAGGRIEWALLPVVSPGRTMLLFTPARLPRRDRMHLVSDLNQRVLEHWAARGVLLAQLLIDPQDRSIVDAYLHCGYRVLAELYYLQASVRGTEPLPAIPPGWAMRPYSTELHGVFAEIISQSYEGSLDCPSINGMRDVEDVLAGHKAAGDFDPRLWFLLVEQGQPLAVLLLSRSAGNTSVELVYLGTVVAARGRGAGDFLVNWALAVAGLENRQHLSLAVDGKNDPALRLYYRHGFRRIGSRTALVFDLRGLARVVSTGVAAPAPTAAF